jgi:hypothetical protein
VLNKVLDVHSQRFLRERIRIRSRTQSAPAAIPNDDTGGVADDRVTTSLQRQQERGLPCAGGACDHYSRHAEVFSPVLRRLANSRPMSTSRTRPGGLFMTAADKSRSSAKTVGVVYCMLGLV